MGCSAWSSACGDAVFGVSFCSNNLANRLSTDCPHPTIRDLYIELDWMGDDGFNDGSHEPSADLKSRIVDTYETPKSGPTIRVHLDDGTLGHGGEVSHADCIADQNGAQDYYQPVNEGDGFKYSTRHGYWRYMLFAHAGCGVLDSACGWAPGAMAIVFDAKYGFDDISFCRDNIGDPDDDKHESAIHELYHTLAPSIKPATNDPTTDDRFRGSVSGGSCSYNENGPPNAPHDKYPDMVMWPCHDVSRDPVFHLNRWSQLAQDGLQGTLGQSPTEWAGASHLDPSAILDHLLSTVEWGGV